MNVNRELLAFLRKQYPVGTRIRLDSMQDPYAPVEAGTTGKLDYIDDAEQFHIKWDNGRVLALIPGVDMLIVAQDVDSTVALMCYIQLSLLGVAGMIKIGNSLTEPITNKDSTENYWFTPMYFSPIWTTRRLFGRC